MVGQQVPLTDERAAAAGTDGHDGMSSLLDEHRRASPNELHPLGEKIFLDRYALKESNKTSISAGDLVVVCVDLTSGQRQIGVVQEVQDGEISVELQSGGTVQRSFEHVDKPVERLPEEMLDRVAGGIASVEAPSRQDEWREKFRWLLDGWKFVPGGRILAAAGTD